MRLFVYVLVIKVPILIYQLCFSLDIPVHTMIIVVNDILCLLEASNLQLACQISYKQIAIGTKHLRPEKMT